MSSKLEAELRGTTFEVIMESRAAARKFIEEHVSIVGSKLESEDNYVYAILPMSVDIDALRKELDPIPLKVSSTRLDGLYFVREAGEALVLDALMDEVDELIRAEGYWEKVEGISKESRVQFLFSDLGWTRESFVEWVNSMELKSCNK